MTKKLWAVVGMFLFLFCLSCQKQETPVYPVTQKGTQVDDYFGTKVADPYRWLEDDQSPEVKKWVEAQNKITFAYLDKIPFREKIRERLKAIYNYPRYTAPTKAGEYYFFSKNDGLQNQSVIYVQKGLAGTPEVFLDPNQMSPDGTVRVNLIGFSKNDRYVAYSRSEAGSDWQEIRVMDIASKGELGDQLRWIKFTGASWQGDDGFFYSGYDAPAPGQELKGLSQFQEIRFHKLGQPQEKDLLVFEDREHPLRYKNVDITEDEKYLFLTLSEGTHGNELYYRDLGRRAKDFKPLIKGFEYDTYVIDNIGDKFLALTNIEAANQRVVLIDPRKPEKKDWQTVIAEKPEVLTGASTVGGQLFCTYLKDATTRAYQYDLQGNLIREISFPALGTARGFYGKRVDPFTFYTFTSFTYPPTIYKYDIAGGVSQVFRTTEVKVKPEDYEVQQVFYQSKDGTRVPMFLVYKKGLERNGKAPAFLYAYGGFNSSTLPAFNPAIYALLENGVIYAVANIRGGGEYGEAWHRAGMLLNRQNVFDDFIAAAEYLIREKYTTSQRLAIAGASNGGLLVGAVMAQRPDLFKVAFPAVGVMDMLRYHKFTVGWGWSVEYGSSDDEKYFKYLYSYSPLHNIKDGVSYPATLATTADHDDRVVPAHSFKFMATLQEKNKGPNPVLIRIETRSGHGSSSTTKAIDEAADKYAFMFKAMGIKPTD
ncbi:MAG TPA: prolyl oligopeptidase family serine peptidase [Acidobacteriota bacterium]